MIRREFTDHEFGRYLREKGASAYDTMPGFDETRAAVVEWRDKAGAIVAIGFYNNVKCRRVIYTADND